MSLHPGTARGAGRVRPAASKAIRSAAGALEVDGEWQKYTVESGAYSREKFFGVNPQLKELVEHLSDEQIRRLRLGGHDPVKVHAAYKAATEHTGQPTVILARTIKGYGLGEAGESARRALER